MMRLLHVQPVLRLVPHPRLRPLDHVFRHLLAAMGGEAVEEDGPPDRPASSERRPPCSPGTPGPAVSCSSSWPIEAQTSVLIDVGAAHRLARIGGER